MKNKKQTNNQAKMNKRIEESIFRNSNNAAKRTERAAHEKCQKKQGRLKLHDS